MDNCIVEIKDDKILIYARKGPLGIRLFLWVILIINLLAPIVGAFFFLAQGDGPHLGIFLSIGLTWLIGYYLLRIILWNSNGKEIISLKENEISYVADFKWFKGSEQSIQLNTEFEVVHNTRGANEGQERLNIRSDENCLESVLDIAATDLNLIEGKIKRRYKNF